MPDSDSIFNTYFQGILRTSRTCLNCKSDTLNYETFDHLKVLLQSCIIKAIYNSLKNTRDCFCNNCSSLRKHLSSSVIYDHPGVLLVLIKRYSVSSSYSRSRRNNIKHTI